MTIKEKIEDAISFNTLYDTLFKCCKGVRWKNNVIYNELHAIGKCLDLSEALQNGTYKESKHKFFKIHEPKERLIESLSFMDRVYQRSFCDNVLYPEMTKHFIYDNCACQKGKGTKFARERLKHHIMDCLNKNNHNVKEVYCLHIDIHHYYPSLRHDLVKDMFRRKTHFLTFKRLEPMLDMFKGDVGYGAGGQIVQIMGISMLDDLDHYIKERLHIKYYVRYMDDMILIGKKEEIVNALEKIKEELSKIDLTVNPTKTKITTLYHGVDFLGFKFSTNHSGKFLMNLLSDNYKRRKEKVKKLKKKVASGELTKETFKEMQQAWEAHASQGTSQKPIERMRKIIGEDLVPKIKNVKKKKKNIQIQTKIQTNNSKNVQQGVIPDGVKNEENSKTKV